MEYERVVNMELTKEEAYKSMVLFLEIYQGEINSEEIGELLGDMALLGDDKTAKPSVWCEWMDCIHKIMMD